jgi:hypothetical protein
MAQYVEYGFSAVVCKPYSIKVLADTVQKVLAGVNK